MSFAVRRRAVLIALLVANVIVWSVPSGVLELVARQRHVLLGRYSYQHFLWGLALLLATLLTAYLTGTADARARRLRLFRLLAVLISSGFCLVAADVVLRIQNPPAYRLDRLAFRRPAHAHWHIAYDDVPEAKRSYPTFRPGYGRVECEFTCDESGYRNRPASPASSDDRPGCDIVALGDSFTEGSRVSDDDAWPARLARLTGRRVYNLGMSGYSPQHYLASFEADGLARRPAVVICAIYEGNDFRSTEVLTDSRVRVKQIFRTSPILQAFDKLLVEGLGAIGAQRRLPELDVLSWMPIGVPAGAAARYYAFAPKQMLDLLADPQNFRSGKKWGLVRDVLTTLRDRCRSIQATLLLTYVPDVAHVVLPLAADRLPGDQVRAFAAIGGKADLPAGKDFLKDLLPYMEVRESVVAEWAQQAGVAFVSLTPVLRAATARGRQVYYTYDQHWTPDGHDVAATALYEYLQSHRLPSDR